MAQARRVVALVGVFAGVCHLGLASAVVTVMTHVLGVVLSVLVRATEDLSPLPLRRVCHLGLIGQLFWFLRLFVGVRALGFDLDLSLRQLRYDLLHILRPRRCLLLAKLIDDSQAITQAFMPIQKTARGRGRPLLLAELSDVVSRGVLPINGLRIGGINRLRPIHKVLDQLLCEVGLWTVWLILLLWLGLRLDKRQQQLSLLLDLVVQTL